MRKIVIFLLLFLSLLGCNRQLSTQDLGDINLSIVNITEVPKGTEYLIQLTNDSEHYIKQNIVLLSFPLITENGQSGNNYKIEASGNKIDIKPGEEVFLRALAPKNVFQEGKVNVEHPRIEIKGYIDEVKEETLFHITGSGKPTQPDKRQN